MYNGTYFYHLSNLTEKARLKVFGEKQKIFRMVLGISDAKIPQALANDCLRLLRIWFAARTRSR